MKGATLAQARAACAAARAELAGRREVQGIGIARVEEGYVVKVDLGDAADVPREFLGVAVRVDVIGRARKR